MSVHDRLRVAVVLPSAGWWALSRHRRPAALARPSAVAPVLAVGEIDKNATFAAPISTAHRAGPVLVCSPGLGVRREPSTEPASRGRLFGSQPDARLRRPLLYRTGAGRCLPGGPAGAGSVGPAATTRTIADVIQAFAKRLVAAGGL